MSERTMHRANGEARHVVGLSGPQQHVLRMIAAFKNFGSRGTKPTIDALTRRGLIRWDGAYLLTDAGREVVAKLNTPAG